MMQIRNRDLLLNIGVIFISILIVCRDVVEISISKSVFIIVSGIICFFGDCTSVFYLLAFITPLANGISYTFISAVALICVLLKRKLSINKNYLIPLFAILAIEALSAVRGNFSIVEYLRFSCVFLVSFLFMTSDWKCNYRQILRFFIIGYMVAMTDLIGQMLMHYPLTELLSLGARIGDTRVMSGIEEGMLLSYNPNGLGAICILATTISVLFYQDTQKKIFLAITAISVLIGMTTLSRTYLLMLLIFLMAILVLSGLSPKVKVTLCVAMTTFGIIASKFLTEYLISFKNRFLVGSIDNNRIEIAKYYLERMFQSTDRIIFGVGLQKYQLKYDYTWSCHNAIQEIVVTWGIIGLIFVILLIYSIVKNAKKINPMSKPIQYLPFALLMVYKQFGQGFLDTPSMLWLLITYCTIACSFSNYKGKQYEDNSIYSNIQ